MKKIILISALLFSAGFYSFAQITLTQTDVASIGDTILVARDTTPNTITVGGTGLQSWNFTSLQVDVLDENAFVDPATTFAASSFPNSNIAVDVNNGTQINYGTVNSGLFNIDGFFGDPIGAGVPVAIQFNPPSKMMKFPSTLNNSFQDTSHFDFVFSDPQLLAFGIDSIKIIHFGYATRTMDAYGLMVTPADSFDCLRQFSNEILLDSIFMHPVGGDWMLVPPTLLPPEMGFTNNPNIDTTYTYDWYANGEGMAVAQVRLDSLGGSVISANFKITDKVVAGLFSAVNVSCNGKCNASASVTAISGYSPYSYLWDSNAGSQTTAMADSLCAGTFSVTITDNVGNKSSAFITITEPIALSDSTNVIDAQCSTCSNGSASVSGIGGTAPYFYNWSGGQSSASIANVLPGTYIVTITDFNGCSLVDTVVVGFWAVGINENQISNIGLQIYPNPTDGTIFLKSDNNEMKTISVYNMVGEIILVEKNSRQITEIDLRGFDSGIYLMKTEGQNFIETQRINIVK